LIFLHACTHPERPVVRARRGVVRGRPVRRYIGPSRPVPPVRTATAPRRRPIGAVAPVRRMCPMAIRLGLSVTAASLQWPQPSASEAARSVGHLYGPAHVAPPPSANAIQPAAGYRRGGVPQWR
jgi:hypothetical protein